MKLFKMAVVGLIVSATFNTQAFAENNQIITYKNQRGSILTLTWQNDKDNTGTLTGTFNTAVGNCQADVGKPLPISGFYNGNAIAITVNFPNCKQVVAMTGNVTNGKNEIFMLWLDANQAKDPRGKEWNTNLIGADSYTKEVNG